LSGEAQPRFDEMLAASSNTQYLGPLYGDAKQRFYEQLDIFLFPTRYANEAEPLVVFEALRSGVHVIACDRGSIPEMLANGAGLACPQERIVESAADWIAKFSRDRLALKQAQQASLLQAQRVRLAARAELEELLRIMRGRACE
jgi:glycosyltransferase involved in cell wall biosynthesis